ncbi:MAG: gliding motility protein GldM, partial [Flavobacterium sp.]|nr:gliding motility protein GldM [Flavobacterium sp.]
MAGGKLTPRQKMINLMYLVFIAMLALNMSKEVLSAFGLMNDKFESANSKSAMSNKDLLATLDSKGSENAGEFGAAKATADKVAVISKTFFDYIEALKKDALKETELEDGKLPFESMDKGATIDEAWFSGDNYSAKGNEIISTIEKYKTEMKNALAGQDKLKANLSEINTKFDVSDVKDREGVSKKYLEYNFEHFPLIASIAKLTAFQNDIKKSEADIYNTLLGKAAVDAASYSKFKGFVVLEKNAYFQGEAVKGTVVLGKYDPDTHPTYITPGIGKIENGQAVISETAGAVGERSIKGEFRFAENGKSIPVAFEGNYVVVPRPNSATISADKMNVVYRGVINPITVSFAGVSDNNVTASAPGMSKGTGVGKYNLSPGQGTELKINVSAKLPDGKVVSDTKMFRIKGIPGPVGAIGGTMGVQKGAKSRLLVSQVSAILPDFDFE